MKRIVAPVMLVAISATLLIKLPLAIADRANAYEWFDPIIDIRGILVEEYVTKPDEEAMRNAIIGGLIDSLDDPYTVYVPPAAEAEFNKGLRGEYVGIGAEVNVVDDYLTIVSPMDDSPALEAGIEAGDIVLEIEGTSTKGLDVDACIDLLMGQPDTDVTMLVRHVDGREQEITVSRREIVTHTVKGLRRDDGVWDYCVDGELGLAYMRVTQFNGTTTNELRDALGELEAKGLNGLILDLRDNPGGALPAAVRMADLFIEDGDIVSVKSRTGEGRTWSARRDGTLPEFPMIVIVNEYSASASEIVAGALQANGRARVLGGRTYGKGSVQEVRELDYDRGILKFTSAHYYLPNGRNIHRSNDNAEWGVDPDPGLVCPENDMQIRARILSRREYEIIHPPDGVTDACADVAWIREHLDDEQLALAVEALQVRVAGEPWPTVSELDATVAAIDRRIQAETRRRNAYMDEIERVERRINELKGLAIVEERPPLLPPDVDLLEGTITVRDKDGNLIGSYLIEGGDLGDALDGVALRPVEE